MNRFSGNFLCCSNKAWQQGNLFATSLLYHLIMQIPKTWGACFPIGKKLLWKNTPLMGVYSIRAPGIIFFWCRKQRRYRLDILKNLTSFWYGNLNHIDGYLQEMPLLHCSRYKNTETPINGARRPQTFARLFRVVFDSKYTFYFGTCTRK